MSKECVICGEVEDYPRHTSTLYICGICVQLLLNTDKEAIREDFNESMLDEDLERAWGLSMFLSDRPKVKLPRSK